MKMQLQKWGNSLAVRIPKAFAVEVGLEAESDVEMSIDRGRLILTVIEKPKHTLESLLQRITPENLHGEWDTGPAVGKEVW